MSWSMLDRIHVLVHLDGILELSFKLLIFIYERTEVAMEVGGRYFAGEILCQQRRSLTKATFY